MKNFKHLITIPTLALLSLGVLSCKNGNDADAVEGKLLFSEIFHGNTFQDVAIEVSSLEDNLSLKNYSINFYKHDKVNFIYTFGDVKLNKNESFVLYNKDFSFKEDLNFDNKEELSSNYITNNSYITLHDPSKNHIDSLNYERITRDLVNNCSLIRLNEYYKPRRKYRPLDFIKVKNTTRKYLGNSKAPLTLEELLEGPKIDETLYGNKPFVVDGTPTGGYSKVTIAHGGLGDGDTTQFDFPAGQGVQNGYEHRCRYLLIDTPEIDHGPGRPDEPYGQMAKRYNNDKLAHATGIIAQSDKNSSLTGNYGRTLAYVWYASVANPKLSDYKMLNCELLKEGLAKFTGSRPNLEMEYNNISYHHYLEYASKYAEENKKNIFGGPDPTFDYSKTL